MKPAGTAKPSAASPAPKSSAAAGGRALARSCKSSEAQERRCGSRVFCSTGFQPVPDRAARHGLKTRATVEHVRRSPLHLRRTAQCASLRGEVPDADGADLYEEPAAMEMQAAGSGDHRGVEE